MGLLKQHRTAEQELIEALGAAARTGNGRDSVGPCPEVAELRRFVGGKYRDAHLREEIVTHLASCDRCISQLRQMRVQRVLVRKMSFAIVTAAVLVIAVWMGFHRPERIGDGVAMIDLRAVAPTRGLENTAGMLTKVPRTAGQAKIILPIGSEGVYDCEILPLGQTVPIQHASGQTSREDHNVILNLPLDLAHLKPGRYSLALRYDGSDWLYYPIILE